MVKDKIIPVEITRGTTPTITAHIKNIRIPLNMVEEVWLYFYQSMKVIKISKELEDVVLDNDNQIISVTLTQEDTLALKPGEAGVQIRILLQDQKALAMNPPQEVIVYEVYRGGVIKR